MRGLVTQALQRHLTKHAENPMGAAVHLQLEAVRRAAAQMVHRKHPLLTHTEQLTDPPPGNICCVSSITIPCMTQKSKNLLRAPHTPPISIHRLQRHHKSTPEGHPPHDPPATSTPDTPRPALTHRTTRHRPAQQGSPTTTNTLTWTRRTSIARAAKPAQTRRAPPHTDHHPRPRPPPSNPPRQGPRHSPGVVPPTRESHRAHRQGPPGPSWPG